MGKTIARLLTIIFQIYTRGGALVIFGAIRNQCTPPPIVKVPSFMQVESIKVQHKATVKF
jgi:hypothetical protein